MIQTGRQADRQTPPLVSDDGTAAANLSNPHMLSGIMSEGSRGLEPELSMGCGKRSNALH